MFIFDFMDCFFLFTSHRCMLVITLLLHMLYVIGFFYSLVLMIRYYRHYTIVTYDLCGITVFRVGRLPLSSIAHYVTGML